MSRLIGFTAHGNSIRVPTPQWGYSVDISMALKFSERGNRTIGTWDNGSSRDVRICRCSFLLNLAQMTVMNRFWTNSDYGRGRDVTLSLGSAPTGFFVGGPDKGDVGAFTVACLGYEPGGQLHRPYKYWQADLVLGIVSAPAYAVPSASNDGNLQISTVTGIRYPQDGYAIQFDAGITSLITHGSDSEYVNAGTGADSYKSKIRLTGKPAKIGELIAALIGTVRKNAFSIITSTDNYAFGVSKGGSATYTAYLASNVLTVTHSKTKEMQVELLANYSSHS